MKKFAVVLSGCGVRDGAEIHEAVLTLLAIKKHGADYEVFAPDVMQHHVVNHLTGKETPGTSRNVLVESARIARGQIKPLNEFNARSFDALVFPGGFGVAKNLCTYAFDGAECTVNHDVEKAVKDMVSLQKPIGAMCISPVVLSKILGNVEVTIGEEMATINNILKMGSKHQKTTHGEVVKDEHRLIYTTPCYMLEANILQIELGTYNLIGAILRDLE
ncbi:MAG: isoprenoid biosynthesis glyoxalase ElbB [Chloroflexota bacterium]|nr:isoprenoid biosynthesis glyoxalase ElbB [Lentimicrobium sp.]